MRRAHENFLKTTLKTMLTAVLLHIIELIIGIVGKKNSRFEVEVTRDSVI